MLDEPWTFPWGAFSLSPSAPRFAVLPTAGSLIPICLTRLPPAVSRTLVNYLFLLSARCLQPCHSHAHTLHPEYQFGLAKIRVRCSCSCREIVIGGFFSKRPDKRCDRDEDDARSAAALSDALGMHDQIHPRRNGAITRLEAHDPW